MKFIESVPTIVIMADTGEGFPDVSTYKQIGQGTILHFVDTGDEYIFHNGVWERDLRRVRALELYYGV